MPPRYAAEPCEAISRLFENRTNGNEVDHNAIVWFFVVDASGHSHGGMTLHHRGDMTWIGFTMSACLAGEMSPR